MGLGIEGDDPTSATTKLLQKHSSLFVLELAQPQSKVLVTEDSHVENGLQLFEGP